MHNNLGMFANEQLLGEEAIGGGGIAIYTDPDATSASAPELRDLLVEDNVAGPGDTADGGGGIWSWSSDPVILTSVIRNNTTQASLGYGGGIYLEGDGSGFTEIFDCEISNNDSDNAGGIAIHYTFARIVNSLIVENDASGTSGHGGGLHTFDSTLAVINCTIADNFADSNGGGAAINGSGGEFEFPLQGQLSSIRNSILWGNKIDGDPDPVAEQLYTNILDEIDLTIATSDFELGEADIYVELESEGPMYDEESNLEGNPLFRNPPDDYRTDVMSPARNTGDDSWVPTDGHNVDQDADLAEPTPDLDLERRIWLGVDMGAYESTCYADFDGNDDVGFGDLTALLLSWGDCPPSGPCPWDLDGSDSVGFNDLIQLLLRWGACGEAEEPPTLESELEAVGLSMGDWEDFEDVMQEGTTEEKENYQCWLKFYRSEQCWPECGEAGCPDDDPFEHDIE